MTAKIFKSFIVVLLFSVILFAKSADNENVLKSNKDFQWREVPGTALPEQEHLTFNIYWKFIKVGQATLEIQGLEDINGRKAYHIYSQAKSAKFFDTFFKVRDVNQSWIDVSSLCSLRYSSDISEGGWKKHEQVDFDHKEQKYYLDDNGTPKQGETVRWVQDVMSALYYLRTQKLEVGKEYTFDAHSGQDHWPLLTKVIKKEKIKVKAGEFDCLVLEPSIRQDAGIFKAQGKLKVWVKNDESKMPIRLRAKIPVGSIHGDLISYNFDYQPRGKESVQNEEGVDLD